MRGMGDQRDHRGGYPEFGVRRAQELQGGKGDDDIADSTGADEETALCGGRGHRRLFDDDRGLDRETAGWIAGGGCAGLITKFAGDRVWLSLARAGGRLDAGRDLEFTRVDRYGLLGELVFFECALGISDACRFKGRKRCIPGKPERDQILVRRGTGVGVKAIGQAEAQEQGTGGAGL